MYTEKELKSLNRSQLIFEAKKNGIKVTSKDSIQGIINKFRTSNLIREYLPAELSIDDQIRDILFKYASEHKDIDVILGYGPEDLKQQIFEKFPNINLDLELAHYHKESILKLDEMRDEMRDLLGDEFIDMLPNIKYVNITTYGGEISLWITPIKGKSFYRSFYYVMDEEDTKIASLINGYVNINTNIRKVYDHIFLNVKYNPIISHIGEAVSRYKMDSKFLKHVWNSYMQYNPTTLCIQIADSILKMKDVIEINTNHNELHLYVTDEDASLLPKGYFTKNKDMISLFHQSLSDLQYEVFTYVNPDHNSIVREYI